MDDVKAPMATTLFIGEKPWQHCDWPHYCNVSGCLHQRRRRGSMDEAEAAAALQEARNIGAEHGTNAGSWVVDGNTDVGTLKALAEAIEGDYLHEALEISGGEPLAPLSGEWAGAYTVRQLAEDCGVEEDTGVDAAVEFAYDELANAYEEAYYQAWEAEARRSILASLPEEEEER
jgi:hypothetical protein